MALSLLAPPPADPAIARRLLDTTAFTVPERAVLGAVVPWTLFELKLAVHHGPHTEVIPLQLVPPVLAADPERVVRSSRAPWSRPAELPTHLLDPVQRELEAFRARRGAIRNASVLVRAEHGYRMTFRTSEEVLTLELALSPPRIVHEERCPVLKPQRTLFGWCRSLFSGGAGPSRSRASGGA